MGEIGEGGEHLLVVTVEQHREQELQSGQQAGEAPAHHIEGRKQQADEREDWQYPGCAVADDRAAAAGRFFFNLCQQAGGIMAIGEHGCAGHEVQAETRVIDEFCHGLLAGEYLCGSRR